MKKIDEKPMDCKVRDTVLRIMERALFYNNTKTEQEKTGNKPTFFVNFYGHTAELEVSIAVNGYIDHGYSERYNVYLTARGYYPVKKIQNQLVTILKRMEEVYSAWYEKEHAKNEEEYQ